MGRKASNASSGAGNRPPKRAAGVGGMGEQDRSRRSGAGADSERSGVPTVCVCAVVILAVYMRTAAPGIPGGDSGELVAEAYQLGTAHPPGYPLYTMLNYAVMHGAAQLGNPAYLANACACVLSAGACLFIGLTVLALGHKYAYNARTAEAGAIAGMGLYAFAPLVWQYAVSAEVFPMNNFFTALILYLAVRFSHTLSMVDALWGAFACGLALCNQHTIVLYEFPLILWMLWCLTGTIARRPLHLLSLSLCFLLGLAPYAYLPIAAIHNPKRGAWGDVTTLAGVFHHLRRGDYGSFKLYSGDVQVTDTVWMRTWAFLQDYSTAQTLHVGGLLALLGVIVSCYLSAQLWSQAAETARREFSGAQHTTTSRNTASAKRRAGKGRSQDVVSEQKTAEGGGRDDDDDTRLAQQQLHDRKAQAQLVTRSCSIGFALLMCQLLYFGVFLSLSNLPMDNLLLFGVLKRFWLMPAVLMATWTGFGVAALAARLERWHGATLLCVASVLLVGVHAWLHFSAADQSENDYFDRYAAAILNSLPENAMLLINYDMQWTSVRYMQICRGIRPDVIAINLSMMTFRWWGTKHHLYSNAVSFPGVRYVPDKSERFADGFTFSEFVDANFLRFKEGGIFVGGQLNYQDPQFDAKYETVPHGIVSKVELRAGSPATVDSQIYHALTVWDSIQQKLPLASLPSPEKYSEETWEYTIMRDTVDHVQEVGAAILERSSEGEFETNHNVVGLLVSLYFLETGLAYDPSTDPAPSVMKNLGLAHVHMVRQKQLPDHPSLPFPDNFYDVFNSTQQIGWPDGMESGWKSWSSIRFMFAWGAFLEHPAAPQDKQYATIKSVYDRVSNAVGPK